MHTRIPEESREIVINRKTGPTPIKLKLNPQTRFKFPPHMHFLDQTVIKHLHTQHFC